MFFGFLGFVFVFALLVGWFGGFFLWFLLLFSGVGVFLFVFGGFGFGFCFGFGVFFCGGEFEGLFTCFFVWGFFYN